MEALVLFVLMALLGALAATFGADTRDLDTRSR
jgi:hypothetical protein